MKPQVRLGLTAAAAFAVSGVLSCAHQKKSSDKSKTASESTNSVAAVCPVDVAPPADLTSAPSEVAIFESPLFKDVLYENLDGLVNGIAANGAFGVNAAWERHERSDWFVEEQKRGADALIGGLLTNNAAAVEAGFKMIEWAFGKQVADGSFRGTNDRFHSTAMFLAAAAQAVSYVLNAPGVDDDHKARARVLLPKLKAAGKWLIGDIWRLGTDYNKPYTHRRYVVALALALTAQLTGETSLMGPARAQISEGISLQTCGVNPELNGHDSSYQAVGIWYASILLSHFPNESFSKDLWSMLQRAASWEASQINTCGKISTEGNTRTGPGTTDTGRSGQVKDVDYNKVIRALAYWHYLSQDPASKFQQQGFDVGWYRGWYQKGSTRDGCSSTYWQ